MLQKGENMRRFLDYIPASFCALYVDYLLSLYIEDGPAIRSYYDWGPPLGLILAIALFQWRRWGRRFSPFSFSLLLALATVGLGTVITSILLSIGSEDILRERLVDVQGYLFFSAFASIVWMPLALVTSALCRLPFWIWDGRDVLRCGAGRLVVYRFRVLGFLVVAALAILGSIWHRQPIPPSWVYRGPNNEYLSLLASGKAPDGSEFVLVGDQSRNSPLAWHIASLDAHDGHVRWKQPLSVASAVCDSNGDVLAAGRGPDPFIFKLSGPDGRVLWKKSAGGDETDFGDLILDRMGRVWVPGWDIQGDFWNRTLTLLDAGNGTLRWNKVTQRVKHPYDSTAEEPRLGQVFPLKDGNAFSIALPHDDYGSDRASGAMQCISGQDGSVIWEQPYPLSSDPYDSLVPVVDEAQQEVLIIFSSRADSHDRANVCSYDLRTGKERWRSVWDDNSGPGLNAALNGAGDLVVWNSFVTQRDPAWWTYFVPLPLFPGDGVVNERAFSRKVLSSVDGSVRESQFLSNFPLTIQDVLSRPGSDKADALFLYEWSDNGPLAGWRAEFFERNFWENPLARSPGGPTPIWPFWAHAILTPSGKFVLKTPTGKDEEEIAGW